MTATETAPTPTRECHETDCHEPARVHSDWCAEHGCYCELCPTPIEDGEDWCPAHESEMRARYSNHRIRYVVSLTPEEYADYKANVRPTPEQWEALRVRD